MKKEYIKPAICSYTIVHEYHLLADSTPESKTRSASDDGWTGEGYTGDVVNGSGGADAKTNKFGIGVYEIFESEDF